MTDNKNYDNFDEFLSSILNGVNKDEDKKESTELAEPFVSLPQTAEDTDNESELSLNEVSGEDDSYPTSVFMFDKKEYNPKTEPDEEPAHAPVKRTKRRIRRKNYSAFGGIVLATLVICVSILLSLFIIVVGRDVLGIESDDNLFTINIPESASVSDIAQQLYNEGIIQYKEVFILFAKVKAKLSDSNGVLYPGDIEVSCNMSYSDLIDGLSEARSAKQTATVTFPEGLTLLDAAEKIEQSGICPADEFIYTFNSSVYGYEFEKYVSSSSLKLYKYEGYLFPDTYEFYLEDSAYNVVRKIKSRTNEILNADVINRAQVLGYSLEEVVTLASIVQKEAGSIDDMKKIASVFINRLKSPEEFPRLQSDTTDSYIENVIKKVMSVEYQDMYDAYDTYTCLGLPVGAICNPGADAINAVLYPEDTEYYYFCSNPETKQTYFAKTYEEHLVNCEAAGLN